jgi:hypothetical protein
MDAEKRKKNEAQWRKHVQALMESGLSSAEYSRRHKISSWALLYWKKQIAEKSGAAPKKMIPVKIAAELPQAPRFSGNTMVRIVLRDGTAIESNGDLATLARLADMLRSHQA